MRKDNILNKKEEIENWRDHHGKPSFKYLQSLVSDDSIEALEKLRFLAEDLDINFNQNTPKEKLMDMIRASVRKNDNSVI